MTESYAKSHLITFWLFHKQTLIVSHHLWQGNCAATKCKCSMQLQAGSIFIKQLQAIGLIYALKARIAAFPKTFCSNISARQIITHTMHNICISVLAEGHIIVMHEQAHTLAKSCISVCLTAHCTVAAEAACLAA